MLRFFVSTRMTLRSLTTLTALSPFLNQRTAKYSNASMRISPDTIVPICNRTSSLNEMGDCGIRNRPSREMLTRTEPSYSRPIYQSVMAIFLLFWSLLDSPLFAAFFIAMLRLQRYVLFLIYQNYRCINSLLLAQNTSIAGLLKSSSVKPNFFNLYTIRFEHSNNRLKAR